jgi:ParB family chromosome partitioning protein
MPTFDKIMQDREKKPFKKREYRSWNLDGTNLTAQETITDNKDINNENIIKLLNADDIINWCLSDRPSNELGDIDSLAADFLSVGQQQPCIVRVNPNIANKYELIVGERRWRAAKKANIPLKAVVKVVSDSEAALIQSAENDNRVDLSDYAKGMSFARLIDSGIIKQNDLVEKLGKSKQYVSALLSFSKIPSEIIAAIGDMSKISARTAEEIKQLSSKGETYIKAIIDFSGKLRSGRAGQKSLKNFVCNHIENKVPELNNKTYSCKGKDFFTVHSTKASQIKMTMSHEISTFLNNLDAEQLDEIYEEMANVLELPLVRARGQ